MRWPAFAFPHTNKNSLMRCGKKSLYAKQASGRTGRHGCGFFAPNFVVFWKK
jgi:hypothetical protein